MSNATPPAHPGVILLEKAMKPLGVSRNKLARDIDVPVGRISDIVSGKRGISPDTALRLAKYFGTSAEMWMRLQWEYDLYVARVTVWPKIDPRVRVFEPNDDTPHGGLREGHHAVEPVLPDLPDPVLPGSGGTVPEPAGGFHEALPEDEPPAEEVAEEPAFEHVATGEPSRRGHEAAVAEVASLQAARPASALAQPAIKPIVQVAPAFDTAPRPAAVAAVAELARQATVAVSSSPVLELAQEFSGEAPSAAPKAVEAVEAVAEEETADLPDDEFDDDEAIIEADLASDIDLAPDLVPPADGDVALTPEPSPTFARAELPPEPAVAQSIIRTEALDAAAPEVVDPIVDSAAEPLLQDASAVSDVPTEVKSGDGFSVPEPVEAYMAETGTSVEPSEPIELSPAALFSAPDSDAPLTGDASISQLRFDDGILAPSMPVEPMTALATSTDVDAAEEVPGGLTDPTAGPAEAEPAPLALVDEVAPPLLQELDDDEPLLLTEELPSLDIPEPDDSRYRVRRGAD